MAKRSESMKALDDLLRQADAKIDALRAELSNLEGYRQGILNSKKAVAGEAVAPLSAVAPSQGEMTARPRVRVKETVLQLLKDNDDKGGLASNEVIDAAMAAGQKLDRATVSSLLSRLKREHVLTVEGSKYRIRKAAAASAPEGDRVVTLNGDRRINSN